MPKPAINSKVTIKKMSVGQQKKVEDALLLLENVADGEWREAVAAWRSAKPDKRSADKAPLFGRFVALAKRLETL